MSDGKVPYGSLPVGAWDAITDVQGVRVGHCTIWEEDPQPVRTGVTVISPLDADYTRESVFAGFHRYNGFGEFGGIHWLRESGVLTSPVFLTSSYSLGAVRDFLMMDPIGKGILPRFHHPCIGETNDGFLNGWGGGHVTPAHIAQAIGALTDGHVDEGCVGGGTGMMAYGFKAGIGTASRVVKTDFGQFTVGVLVQSNHGRRKDFRFNGIPLGDRLDASRVPNPQRVEDGSIVVVVATDAPLIPTQCDRLAQRAVAGISLAGGPGHNSSGEFVIAFSTANRLPALGGVIVENLMMFPNESIAPLFEATIEATGAAIVNSLLAAKTTKGIGGATVWALDRAVLEEAIREAQNPVRQAQIGPAAGRPLGGRK